MGGKDVISGDLTAGQLSSFVFYSLLVAGAFGAISEVIGDIQRAAGAAEELMDLLEVESDVTDPELPVSPPENVQGNVEFKDLTFFYPSRQEIAALSDVSFNVTAGETTALAGPSGAGKSTMLQLLLRFYNPTQGNIIVDGVDITGLKIRDARDMFAYVSQEPIIFSASARENISYGNLSASDEEVEDAARAASAYDFINALPERFDTFLGEKGVRLSGGERQRIVIARAILKNAKILLLDEATSSLDAENEKIVQEALEKLMENKTTIVIAHRLSTVMNADKIIVIDEGKIEAVGTHEELMKKCGLYERLAKLQLEA